MAHQGVALPSALTRHRHGDRAGEVFPRRGAGGPPGHRELRAGQAEVQRVSWDAGRDGAGAACGVHLQGSWTGSAIKNFKKK